MEAIRSWFTVAAALLAFATITGCGACAAVTSASTTGSLTEPVPSPSCCTPPPSPAPTAIVPPRGPITLTDPPYNSIFQVKVGTVITLLLNEPTSAENVSGPDSSNTAVVERTSHDVTSQRITGTFHAIAEGRADLEAEANPKCGGAASKGWLVTIVVAR